MTLFYRNMVMAAKLESQEGQDAGPTGAANAIQAVDATITPLAGRSVPRAIVRPYMGAYPEKLVGRHVNLQFRTEMAAPGERAVAPAYGPLLRASGLAQTLFAATGNGTIAAAAVAAPGNTGAFTYTRTTAYTGTRGREVTLLCTTPGGSGTAEFTVSAPASGSLGAYNQTGVVMTDTQPFALGGDAVISPTIGTGFAENDSFTIRVDPPRVEYSPVSTGFESITLYFEMDGILHVGLGARGELGWTVESGIPYWTHDFNGLFVAPVDDAIVGADFSAWPEPLLAEPANTPEFALHGFQTPKLSSFTGQFGNQVDPRFLVNHESVPITDRSITGTCRIDMTLLATVDWFEIASASTKGALAFQHGIDAGDIVRIDAPHVQVREPRYGNDRGIVVAELGLLFVPSDAGNDEILITIA